MDLEKIFKNLILINLAIYVILIISIFFEPEEITAIKDQLGFGIFDSDSGAIIGGIIAIAILVIYPINLFLLYRFISFGKPLYTIMFIVTVAYSLSSGPYILDAFSGAMDLLDSAMYGAILVFLYFTPIKDKFNAQ